MLDKNSIFNSSITYSQFLNSAHANEAAISAQSLDFFRQPDEEAFHLLYSTKKKQAAVYRLIFLSFACLFFALGLLVYFKTANWHCEFYFSNCQLIKTLTYFICFLFSAGSCSLSFLIRPEREAIHFLTHATKKQLNTLYKSFQQMVKRSSMESEKLAFSCHSIYDKAIEIIQENEHKSLLLLDRVFLARQLSWPVKEQLFNQAIFEAEEQFKQAVAAFKEDVHQKFYMTLN